MIGAELDIDYPSDYTTADEPQVLEQGQTVKVEDGVREGYVYEYTGPSVEMYKYTTSDGTRTLNNGDLVKVNSGYDSTKGTGTAIYRYTGNNGSLVNLDNADYLDTNSWESVGSAKLSMQDYGNEDLWKQVNLVEAPVEVLSYILDSNIAATGDMFVTTLSDQSIDALVVAGSAAASGAGVGVSVSGAGAVAVNTISTDLKAFIEGDGTEGVSAGSLTISAEDASSISAVTGAASLAAAFGGVGVAVSIGVSGAYNQISNNVAAYIYNAGDSGGITTTTGNITVEATESATINSLTAAASLGVGIGGVGVAVSGAGAAATNVILTSTEAYVLDSHLDSGGNVTIKASDTSTINAVVLASTAAIAGGAVGVGVSIGTSYAGNFIGSEYDYAGAIAYVKNSTVEADDAFTQTAVSEETIKAAVVAVSAAVAPGGVGVGVSGTGVVAINAIAADIKSTVENSTINAGSVKLTADDTSQIMAFAGSASVAAAFGGVGVGVSIGVALAHNMIHNDVAATILNSSVTSTSGSIGVHALEHSQINAVSAAASSALTVGGVAVSVSGAGAEATNVVLTKTNAYIENSTVDSAGDVNVSAQSLSASPDIFTFTVADGADFAGRMDDADSIVEDDPDTGINERNNDISADELFIAELSSTLTGKGLINSGDLAVTIRDQGGEWSVVDRITGSAYIIKRSGNDFSVATPTIAASVVSASASVAGGAVGVGVSVGLSFARNLVGWDLSIDTPYTYTTADLRTQITDGDRVKVESGVRAGDVYEYIGTESQLPKEGETYVDLKTQDYGNTDLWKQVNLVESPVEVQAYVLNSSIDAAGDLTQTVISDQSIDALVVAGSTAASAGGVGVSVSGAGAIAINTISTDIKSYIEGDKAISDDETAGIKAGTITLTAGDTSTITAVTGAASLAAAFGGVGVGVSIGVSGAYNQISNDVAAYIHNADDGVKTTGGGAITIEATEAATIKSLTSAASLSAAVAGVGVAVSGAGAVATNIILNKTNAYITDSTVKSDGDIILEATDTSAINAVVAASSAAVGAGGVGVGVSIGASVARNLIGYNLFNANVPAEVRAYIADSDITAAGELSQTATTDEDINAKVLAASAAVSIGAVGVSVSGSGVLASNMISTDVEASVTDSDVDVKSMTLLADDTSTITSDAGAASVAASFGGVGVAVSLGLAVADNRISNKVKAYVYGSSVKTTDGDLEIGADENATITTTSVAGSAAASASIFSVAASGGGATATNIINTITEAFVDQSDLVINGDLDVHAKDVSTTVAKTGSASVAAGIISVAMGGSIGIGRITSTTKAYVKDSDVDAKDIIINAAAQPKAEVRVYGVNAGTLAVGVSEAESTVSPTVEAYIGGNGKTITADSLDVNAQQLLPQSGYTGKATATGSAGGLIGIDATISNVTNNSTVKSYVADNAILIISGAATVSAGNETRQLAEANSTAGGVVAAGATVAGASSDTTVAAFLGSGVDFTGQSLRVLASGTDTNHAQTTAGAGGVAAGAAARPVTINTSETTAGIGDNAHIDLTGSGSGTLDVRATHQAIFGTTVLTDAYGALSGSGADADSRINSTVTVSVGDSATVMGKDIDLLATNRIDGDNYIKGSTGGIVSAAGADSDTTIALDTQVRVGSDAHLEVVGMASNAHNFSLAALNILNVTDQVIFTTGGALSGAGADCTIETTLDRARVAVGSGAELLGVGALDLSARGQGDVRGTVSVETYGAGTVSVGTTRVELHPDNRIEIAADAHLRAFGDLNLSAGRSPDANMITAADRYTVEARWDGFAGSAIPISDIDAKAFIVQQNRIDVASGALLQTGRQANLYAEGLGLVDLTGKAKAVSWVSEAADGLNSLLGGGGDEQFEGKELAEAHGLVNVEGTVETGLTRHQTLILDWNEAAGTIEATADLGITFTTSFQEVESELVQALQDAQNALDQFGHTNGTLKTYYEGEIKRLKGELDALGLGVDVSHEDESDTLYPKRSVLTVTVNPIWAQAGVVDVRSDQLQGSGLFIAPSDTTVEIINNTPAFLELMGITIPDINGGLYLNGVLVETNAQLQSVNADSAVSDNSQGFSGVDPHVVAGTADFGLPAIGQENKPSIVVRNDLDVNSITPPEGGQYVWPDIKVLGPDDGGQGIYNDGGEVLLQTLPSGKGSIRIEGTLRAEGLTVIAGGDVFITGLSSYSVGGEPASLLGAEPGGTSGTYGAGSATAPGVAEASATAVDNVAGDPQAQPYSMYGDRIHIDAEYINVNGIMQSGRDSYTLNIGTAAYTEAVFEMAKGKAGSIYLKETSLANPGFSVYFNSVDGQFEVSELKASGGFIELFGNILNTGSGEIRLLGGYAAVEINNTTTFDLVLNRLDVSERGKGTLIIEDKANGRPDVSGIEAAVADAYTSLYQWTEDGVLLTTNGTSDPDHPGTQTTIANESKYQPNELLRYGWTTVVEKTTIREEYVKSGSWLGVVPDVFQNASFEWDSETVQSPPHYAGSGPYYYFGPTSAELYKQVYDQVYMENLFWGFEYAKTQATQAAELAEDYTFDYNYVELSNTGPQRYWHDDHWTWYGSHVYESRYREIEGGEAHYTHTVGAHRLIDINFIGQSEGSVTINSTGGGDVLLHGAILNQSGVTSVSTTGAIESLGESAYITGRQISLNATGDIGGIQALAINLTDPVSSYTGAEGLVATSLTGDITISELSGDLHIDTVAALGGGDVELTAAGTISVARATVSTWHAGLVSGGSISLIAEGGGIGNGDGTTAPSLVVDSGVLAPGAMATTAQASVSATAAGDVYLTEQSGDLWVDQISTTGDVWIDVPDGDLLDANSFQIRDERTYNELKEGIWADLQLTDSTGAQTKIDDTRDSYRAIKEQEYRSYWTYRSQQTDPSVYDADFRVCLSPAEEDYYRSELSYDDAAIETLENKRTAEYHTLHQQFAGYFAERGEAFPTSYDSEFEYVLSTAETTALTGSIKVWTEDELLSLIGGGLLKSVTDTQVTIEEANLIAGDVTVSVHGQIGRTVEPTLIVLDGHKFTDDERVAMAAAERADVTYLSAGTIDANVTFDAAAHSMTRTDGATWNGFSAGMAIAVYGNTANATEGLSYYTVESVAGAVMTLETGAELTSEVGKDVTIGVIVLGPTFESLATTLLSVTFADNGYTSTGRAGDTIVRTDGSWLADGFTVGSLVRIDGTTVNATDIGTCYRVADVSVSVLTLSGRDKLTTENEPVTVTIERGQSPHIEMIRIDNRDDLNLNTSGVVTATAGDDIFLGSAPVDGLERLLQINRIQAGDTADPGSVRIKVGAGISNAAGAGSVNVLSGDLLLEAGDGGVGTEQTPFITDLFGTSTITARATEGVYISEQNAGGTAGNMYVESVYSETGVASLVADGSIVDALNTDFTKIKAVSIILAAGDAIGEAGISPDYLELDMALSGTVYATAEGSVWLAETFNDMNIDTVLSRTGDVDLKAHQSIIDFVDNGSGLASRPDVDIFGNNIILTAEFGGIGVSGNDVDIDTAHSATGTLTAASFLNSYLLETQGDLLLNTISTGGYDSGYTAFIATPTGSIKNGRASGSNVLSGKTYLFAARDIGEDGNAIATEVGYIESKSTTGSTWISNTGALTVGGVVDKDAPGMQAGGSIVTVTHSPMRIDENIEAQGDIIKTAVEKSAPGDDITVAETASLTSLQGSVWLNAGDNILLASG
jgi:hypothetical protein